MTTVDFQSTPHNRNPSAYSRGSGSVVGETPRPLELDGDVAALEQLFLNLFINAAQALSPGGAARVDAERRNGMIDVTVADTGAGMSARQLAEMHQPFRSSKREGTGLGLKIARRIVSNHRGELHVESVLGHGTTVRVTFPVRA